MQSWTVGDARIVRIIETEDTSMTAEAVLPDAIPERVLPIDWLRPHFITEEGQLITSIFALAVESCGQKIVIDTCLGNDKPRIVPQWNERQGSFLEDLAAAGFPADSIDAVVCTHLHPDHVGWNTRWTGSEWVPTFPNARYLFSRLDWEWLDKQPVSPLGDYAGDSVRPIFAAGLAEVFEPDFALNDEITLISTPGHSPGHISVVIESADESAVITGDLMHHPCQLAHPEWRSTFDFDGDAAQETREAFLRRHADRDSLVIGSHFATPAAGRVVSDADAYRLDTDTD